MCGATLMANLSSGQSESDVAGGRFRRGDFVARDKILMPAAQ
jgi:hypothetical protein